MLQDTSHHGKASSSSRRLLLAFELLLGVTLLVSCVRVARTGALIWILTVGLEIAVILMLELFRTSAYREAPMPPREEDVQTAVQSEAAIETKAEVEKRDNAYISNIVLSACLINIMRYRFEVLENGKKSGLYIDFDLHQ